MLADLTTLIKLFGGFHKQNSILILVSLSGIPYMEPILYTHKSLKNLNVQCY